MSSLLDALRCFLHGFACAGRGFTCALRTETNLRFHLVSTVYVLLFSLYFGFGVGEYALLIGTIAVVMSCELLNTAVETVVNRISPEYSLFARRAKDIAAAAVLVTAVGAVLIGVLLFWDPAGWVRMGEDFMSHPYKPLLLFLLLVPSIWFILWFRLPVGTPPADRRAKVPKQGTERRGTA